MIWCVEDDPSIREIEVYALRSTGLEAHGFEDGNVFWEALQEHQPDLVLLEFVLALTLEMTVGSPLSFELACKVFDMKATHPVLFETAVICAAVGLMCPAMSFLAAIIYYPDYTGFNVLTLLANWIKLIFHKKNVKIA